jgi:methylmalonyl-CoA mutase cobalamin-binding subunit
VKKQVLVSVEDGHLERMPAVVDELKARGLEVKRSMPALGVVSGSADHDKLASLGEVDGVRSVEEERSVQIPPPDAPIQ